MTPSFTPCIEAKVPASLFKKKIQADLVIFVTAKSEDANFVAWANTCQVDGNSGRPNAGQVNMNLKYLKTDFKTFFDVFGTVIHEIVHVLGFSSSMYKLFIDPVFGKRLGEANVVKDFTAGGRTFKTLVTKKVKSFVNSHFGCAAKSLPGGPLEDDNSTPGSAGSHWEKMFFSSEFMSAVSVTNPVISQLTMALLEDSGWYKFNKGADFDGVTIDYEPFFWLRGKGCEVFTEKCPSSSSSCPNEDIRKLGCSYDNTFRGVCRKVGFANECSYYAPWTPYVDYDCRELYHENDDWKLQGERYGEERGAMSRCWNGEITNLTLKYRKKKNFCFKSSCTSSGQLSLTYKGKSYPCTGNNSKIQINDGTVKGFVTCPSHNKRFCERMKNACPNDCMGKGRCMANGQCLCYDGFVGQDCANEITMTYKALWGTSQEFETVKKTTCHGEGTWLEGSDTCLCKIGWKGAGCCEEDSLAASYWNGPTELMGPVYSRPSTCEARLPNDGKSNGASGSVNISTGGSNGSVHTSTSDEVTNSEKAAINFVGFLTLLFALLAIN
jgi:hypothetical protein